MSDNTLNTMESKNIKDYLHLYLGHVMHYTGKGLPFKGTAVDEVLTIENFELLSFSNQRSLVLRSLSDMTEEEAKCFYSFGGSHSIVNPKYAINQIFGPNLFYEGYNRVQIAQLMHYLLSKGFDLFGLLDAGVAIKKSQ